MVDMINRILDEIGAVVKGKDEVIRNVLMALLSEGHVLIEDVPGVGKTTLALAFSKVLGLDYKRVQFTPDVVPSDITGFTMYDKNSGRFRYEKGAAFCNIFLADEINRTSSKTQSALLEVMEEKQATVDGKSHPLPRPFMVIATQNPEGGAGTQRLPHAQLDRFLIKISMGYPDFESELDMVRDRQKTNPLEKAEKVCGIEDILKMQEEAGSVHISEEVMAYMTGLCRRTRGDEMISLGISPRGTLALSRMARAAAYMEGRDFVTPADIRTVFLHVCCHRVRLSSKARAEEKDERRVLSEILDSEKIPGAL